MNATISYLTLGVRDLDRQLRFYRDGFGFTIKRQYRNDQDPQHDFVFFDLGAITLALYPRAALAADAAIVDAPPGHDRNAGLAISYNVVSRQHLDELMSRLQHAGACITRPVSRQPWGGYAGYLQDPEGQLWEIVWSPSRNPACQ